MPLPQSPPAHCWKPQSSIACDHRMPNILDCLDGRMDSDMNHMVQDTFPLLPVVNKGIASFAQRHWHSCSYWVCVSMEEKSDIGVNVKIKMKLTLMKNCECLGLLGYGVGCLISGCHLSDTSWALSCDSRCHRSRCLFSLFGQVLGLSPTKLWPVASGPWYLP